MHISIPLMLNMIDRMSGGVEDTPIDVSSSYAYTDIELQLYENIVKYFVTVMKDSWHDYSNLDFSIGKLETSQGLFQQIGMDEIVIIIVLEVKLNDVTEKINICLPAPLLFNIFAEIEERNAPQPKITGNEDETAKEIFSPIKEASLEISAKIGGATVYLKDICDLEIGDVINMNRPKNTDIDVLIEDNLWFRGKMGIKDKNIAVKINDVCNK
ncbi:MAG: FliM/FliN family flagellar motor switch protein, partial [Anaerotignaceae bacterium]